MIARVPALVVGGGSVGLFTALLLRRHGVPTVLVERRDGPSIHPRATGIGARTVEILRELDLADAVDARSVDMTVGGLGKVVAPTLAEADFSGPAATPRPSAGGPAAAPFRLRGICAQDRLDAVLADAAAARDVDLRWSTRLLGLLQDGDGVTVELDGPDGRSELRCDHVVAADGARSAVRDRLGIGTSGPGDLGTPKVGILFRAPLQPFLRGASFATCTITTPDAPGLLVMVDGDQEWVFHVTGTDAADFPPERCVALVRAAVGAPDLPVEVRSVLGWQPRALLADRFADGRVLLAGDAAHAMAAMGGFGLNTGVADAHNLAWKLAAVHRGEAGPGLLDTYEAERRPVAAATIDQALRRAADVRLHWGVGPEADAMRAAAGVWAAPIVHVGQRYASAAIVDGDPALPSTTELAAVLDGSPGSRVPHVWCDPDQTVSTLDLVGPGWTLLTGPGAAGWPATTADLAVHRVTAPGWAEAAGITPGGALLVRPDGIVAWRAVTAPVDPSEPGRVLAELLHRATVQR